VTPRSAGGYDPRRSERPVVTHPPCGKKIRLEADDWGYCRTCQMEFDGKDLANKGPGR
jgi:hypothetical protein